MTTHFLGGYYWVQGSHLEGKALLPSPFWSLSACLCLHFPGPQALSWVNTDKEAEERYRDGFRLTKEDYKALQVSVDRLFEHEQLGWPNVILNLELALELGRRYLLKVPRMRLLALALPAPYVEQYLEEERQTTAGFGQPGLVLQLEKKEPIPTESWQVRGYELLGAELGAFHSFACNNLETDYREELGITLNAEGLISSYQEAVLATTYTLREDVGAEPVLWQPWLVLERQGLPLDGLF